MLSKNKYELLSHLAAKEQVYISARRSRDIIAKWEATCSVDDIVNVDKGSLNTKVTERQLLRIEKEVFKRRDSTGPKLKAKLGLQVSVRSIQRYIKALGWKKVVMNKISEQNIL